MRPKAIICVLSVLLLVGVTESLFAGGRKERSRESRETQRERQHEQARELADEYNQRSIEEDTEYGCILCENDEDGSYSNTPVVQGSAHRVDPGTEDDCPPGTTGTAMFHTHGAESGSDYQDERLSSSDLGYTISGLDVYVATPSDRLVYYDYDRRLEEGYNGEEIPRR